MSKRSHESVSLRDVVKDDPLLPFDLVSSIVAAAAFLIVLVA